MCVTRATFLWCVCLFGCCYRCCCTPLLPTEHVTHSQTSQCKVIHARLAPFLWKLLRVFACRTRAPALSLTARRRGLSCGCCGYDGDNTRYDLRESPTAARGQGVKRLLRTSGRAPRRYYSQTRALLIWWCADATVKFDGFRRSAPSLPFVTKRLAALREEGTKKKKSDAARVAAFAQVPITCPPFSSRRLGRDGRTCAGHTSTCGV